MAESIALRPFEQDRFERLVDLARTRFDLQLLVTEARALLHSSTSYLPPAPSEAEPRPYIRADFLRWLLTDSEAAKFVDPKGFCVWSVTVAAPLDLQGCKIPHPVYFWGNDIGAEFTLFTAEVKSLFIFGGTLRKGLIADGITVRGPLFIKDVKSSGMIHLIGADIERNLDLSGTELTGDGAMLVLDGARIRGSAFLHQGFRSSGEVRMLNARIGGDLAFNGASLHATGRALSLDKVVVDGVLSLAEWTNADGFVTPFTSNGSVNLPAAEIKGDLNCSGADLAATGEALNLRTAKIHGHVYLKEGFKARGQINMHSAEVGNSVDMSGAALTEAPIAVVLEQASFGGALSFCDGFTSFGWLDMKSAQIGGNLVCDNCKLPLPYCANTTIEGDLQWTGIIDPDKTQLCLNGARIKNLRDERESWPCTGGLRLDGLTYDELTLHSPRSESSRKENELGPEHPLNVDDRIEWLQRQSSADQAEPQPWMQLSALLRAKGDEDGAKRIVFELRRVQASSDNMAVRLWKITFARLQQQPVRVVASIVLTTLMTTCLFWFAERRGAIAPTNKDAYVAWATGSRVDAAYPRFNPLIYSLENDLPLLKFGLDDKWAPDPSYRPKDPILTYNTLRWARITLIIWGWFQATVLATAIGSRFRT